MGVVEILIVLVIALVVFGGYKKLPQLMGSAGRNARIGGEKAKELADRVGPQIGDRVGKAGDRFDPAKVGRSAGKGVREARELRDSFKGTLDSPKEREAKAQRPAERSPQTRTEPAPQPAPERVPTEQTPQPEPDPEPGADDRDADRRS